MNKTMPGIYQGTIIEISTHQRVAYLQTTTDQILELTFKGDSVLTDKGKQLPLKELKKGNKIEVQLNELNGSMEVEKVNVYY